VGRSDAVPSEYSDRGEGSGAASARLLISAAGVCSDVSRSRAAGCVSTRVVAGPGSSNPAPCGWDSVRLLSVVAAGGRRRGRPGWRSPRRSDLVARASPRSVGVRLDSFGFRSAPPSCDAGPALPSYAGGAVGGGDSVCSGAEATSGTRSSLTGDDGGRAGRGAVTFTGALVATGESIARNVAVPLTAPMKNAVAKSPPMETGRRFEASARRARR
jgi:hypothetical protein